MNQDRESSQNSGGTDQVLGLVTDPDMPTQVGSRLKDRLAEWLGERTGGKWVVEVVSHPVTAGEFDSERILQDLERFRDRYGWGYAICLTDLPLLLGKGPLLADASIRRRAALVSLPALGALGPYRRMLRILTRLLDDLVEAEGTGRTIGRLAPVRRTVPEDQRVDARYVTSRVRGWLRLVAGMVRGNRPWQLLWGLSSALAAALAATGFGLFTSTVWQIGDVLSPWRAAGAMLFSLTLMTVWLIAAHGLWERVGDGVRDRRVALLYNTSTVVTLTLGVACLYGLVYVVSFVAAISLIDPSVLANMVGHPAGPATYARLAWMVATMAIIAGSLGSSLETDAAVRQAAYGYREEQRRARHAEESERADESGRTERAET
ncbi:5,10-methylene-tetrahydrofolate dehydrogenase [Saccharopolyspora erythraea]|uniref:5,10-methylene-tetrahydrofolate dehydrogenase n=1 Tax=Saccharopolyspora erythraea TaxID=1836 RepID=UPI001BADB4AB|nr:5,10-methylene-tetrahydrofolate dehydrogenase [Saccharopolyspora erythraea]QUH00642.1 5,10-methylene-tetrahydrofolate dehydrogenase [Saccharopolyspora erythraea]